MVTVPEGLNTQPRMPGCLHYSYHRSIHHPLILALLAQDSKYMVAKPGSQGCRGVIRGGLLRLLREELTSHQDLCNGAGLGGLQFPKSSTWVQMLRSQTVTDAHYFKCSEYSQLGIFFRQFSRLVVSDSLRPHESHHARPPCPSPTPGVHSNLCPSSWWCHPAISSSVVPFSSCPQSLPASESFLISQLFAWGGQSIGVSALASFLPVNTQDWSLLEWTGWISLQSKGLSRVFSNKTVQKHQLFSAQLSSQTNSHIHTWPLGKP